jgi:hypothetical protein
MCTQLCEAKLRFEAKSRDDDAARPQAQCDRLTCSPTFCRIYMVIRSIDLSRITELRSVLDRMMVGCLPVCRFQYWLKPISQHWRL